ncbi:MAG: DedA family protein [Sulfurospirillaceae bacterium]|nr:DedA family protein [Sulfurospirillaceae bacterium]
MEAYLLELMKTYGYVILFVWCILEGETALFMAGLLVHTGHMNLFIAIGFATAGAFCGDQFYFYLGHSKKNFVYRKFVKQRRKIALAKRLLQKYDWHLIFLQRYIYGMRTIIPLSIGLSGFSIKRFALINIFSALCWSTVIMSPVAYFGKHIIALFSLLKPYWYIALPLALAVFGLFYFYIHKKLEAAYDKK